MASVVKTGLWYLDGKVCLCPMSSSNVFGSISVNAVRSETPFHQSFRCQDASISVNAERSETPFHKSTERSETPFKSTDDYQKAFMDPFAIFCERTIPRKFFFPVYHMSLNVVSKGLPSDASQSPPSQSPLFPSLALAFDKDNHPILPLWNTDEDRPLNDLKQLLHDYMEAAWSRCIGHIYTVLC
jgi:hypothetical protein